VKYASFFPRSEHLRQSDRIDRSSALSNVKSRRSSHLLSRILLSGILVGEECRNRKFRLATDVPTRRTRGCRVNRRARTCPLEQLTFLSVNIHARLDSSARIKGNLFLPSSPLAVSRLPMMQNIYLDNFCLARVLYSYSVSRGCAFLKETREDIYWHFRILLSFWTLRLNNTFRIWRLNVTIHDTIDNSLLLSRQVSFQAISSDWPRPSSIAVLSVRTRIDGKFAAVDTTIEQSGTLSVRPGAADQVESNPSRAEPSEAEATGLARLPVIEPLAYCRRVRHVTRECTHEWG